MYTDKTRRTWPTLLLAACLLLVVIGLFSHVRQVSRRDMAEESAAALKAAVQRGALQCYAVEGVYPPDLEYLEEHYGLQINREAFYISYDAFASNLPPDVRVTPRTGA